MRSSFDERGRSLDDSLTHSARLSIVTSIQKRSVESALMATKKIRFSIRENKCAVQIPQEFQLGGGKIKIQPCGNTPLFRHKKTLMGATHGQSKEVLGRLHAPGSATTRLPNAEASFRIKLRIVSPGSSLHSERHHSTEIPPIPMGDSAQRSNRRGRRSDRWIS